MKCLCTVLLVLFSFITSAQTLLFDSTFGANGKVILNTGFTNLYIRDAAMQADGKTLVLVNATQNGYPSVALLRYGVDGMIDSSFSGDGIADNPFTGGSGYRASAVKVQPDGKPVVVGYGNGTSEASFIIRYTTSGSLDSIFGNGGLVFLQRSFAFSRDFVILSNGRFMLLSNGATANYVPALVRVNSNGSVDSTFATAGMYVLPAYAYTLGTSIDLQTDGKYLVLTSGEMIRITTTGTLDNTFGSGGRVSLGSGVSIALQPGGKIVARSGAIAGTTIATRLIRFNTNGTTDNTFGTNGERNIYFDTTRFIAGSYPTNSVEETTVQADGKILIGGCTKTSSGTYKPAVVRLTVNGAFDSTFGTNGVATAQTNSYNSYGLVALQQGNGNIALTGFARNYDHLGIAVLPLTATGQSNAPLGSILSLTSDRSGSAGRSVLVQTDQKIVGIKTRNNGVFNELSVDRFDANGAPDTGYGSYGTSTIDLPPVPEAMYCGLLSNNKLMVAASLSDFELSTSSLVVRFNSNGSLDSSFGTAGKLLLKPASRYINLYLIHAAFQTDGKAVLLVKQSGTIVVDSVFIIRINTDGSYDNTFNGNGRRYLSPANGNSYTRVCLQLDGKILLADDRYSPPNNNRHTYVQRLNVNGTTDATFNAGTARDVLFVASNLVLQPDGKILAAGLDYPAIKMARLSTAGVLDSSFAASGIDSLSLSVYATPDIIGMAVATDGKILVKAHTYIPAQDGPTVQLNQLLPNGQNDSTFGTNGLAVVSRLYSRDYSGQTIALQPDNKMLITGQSNNGPDNAMGFTLRVKRENAAGRLYTFTGSGLWSNPTNWADGVVPPTTILTGSNLIINPPATGECVVDVVVHVQAGANVVVKGGRKLRLQGGLIIQ